ncbi:LLM class flavin-dependent oxidoreductase [Streptomyces sp. NPDC008343]|uniref:LLM class flavin-dependent oxidoreductase n=1 Tax=Streptomyces sp. NPDC008343 TaxID=3364828 RepID=UPI0036E6CD12
MAVSVREPFGIARGAASVAAVTGRPVGVGLGTSSRRVVEGVHGVPRARPAAAMEGSGAALRVFLHGRPGEPPVVPGSVFPRRLPPPGGPLTVAPFGDRAIAAAAAHADRMLLDIVSPEQVRTLRGKLEAAATRAGRTSPPTPAAWLPAAVDPDPDSLAQVLRGIAGYLTVPGYSDMFEAAGFGEAVEPARTGADPGTPVRALPPRRRAWSAWWATWTPYARVPRRTPTQDWTRSPPCWRRRATRAGSGR